MPALRHPGAAAAWTPRGTRARRRRRAAEDAAFVSQFKQYVVDSNSEELEDWLINILIWSIYQWSN